jgi:Xaa-Pro aminopeptidase
VSQRKSRLLISEGQLNADLYYATRFVVEVPSVYLEADGRKTLLVSDLEYGRARAEARVDDVISTTPYENRLREAKEEPRLSSVIDLFLKERAVREVEVPASFPLGHAERLRKLGHALVVREDPFFPERAVKLPEEVRAIEETQAHMEEAMALAVGAIRKAAVRGGVLHENGAPLTAEGLRFQIQKLLLERNVLASNVIVAGGDQGADPHRRGDGPLPAGKTIILDIFGRSMTTLYWGDMTRTVVRGKAAPAVRKLYEDVLAAQELVFSKVQDGAEGHKIHQAVSDLFKERGNENGEVDGRKTGFFHGTGHGVGIEIHEAPRMGKLASKLASGNVVTVEPGLYYPGIGAVRLEDVVVVGASGCRNLNRFPKELEVG